MAANLSGRIEDDQRTQSSWRARDYSLPAGGPRRQQYSHSARVQLRSREGIHRRRPQIRGRGDSSRQGAMGNSWHQSPHHQAGWFHRQL